MMYLILTKDFIPCIENSIHRIFSVDLSTSIYGGSTVIADCLLIFAESRLSEGFTVYIGNPCYLFIWPLENKTLTHPLRSPEWKEANIILWPLIRTSTEKASVTYS